MQHQDKWKKKFEQIDIWQRIYHNDLDELYAVCKSLQNRIGGIFIFRFIFVLFNEKNLCYTHIVEWPQSIHFIKKNQVSIKKNGYIWSVDWKAVLNATTKNVSYWIWQGIFVHQCLCALPRLTT